MIRVSNKKIETPIILEENAPLLLIVENPAEYYRLTEEFIKAFEGAESEFSFWNGTESFKPSDGGELVYNLFSFNAADKKIISLLYKKLYAEYLGGDFMLSFNELNGAAERFLLSLTETSDIRLEYDLPTVEGLLKLFAVRPIKEGETLLEKLISYVNIFTELKNASFFVFAGLKSVLSDNELKEFYKHCALAKVSLLVIEPFLKRPIDKIERAIIITEDLCEIVENIHCE